MKKMFINFLNKEMDTRDTIKLFSLGLLALGTGGLFFSAKYDINHRAIFSFLVENFAVPPKEFFGVDVSKFENKVVYLSGEPHVNLFSYDPYFDVYVKNCIYLRRVSEMCQNYESTETTTNSKGDKYTVNTIKERWDENEIDTSLNPSFPIHLRSLNFISTDVILNHFFIHPRYIREILQNKEKRLNPKEHAKMQSQMSKYKNDKEYTWTLDQYYLYGRRKYSKNKIGDIRHCYYYLCINPEDGLSVIGMVKDGQVVPISINNKWNLFFVKDYLETPVNMIKNTVLHIRNTFYLLFFISLTVNCIGFHLEMEKPLNSKTKEKLPTISVTNFLNRFNSFNPILRSLAIGCLFSFTIFKFVSWTEKDSVLKANKIRRLYSYRQISKVELTYEEQNVEYHKFIGNKIGE